MTTENQDPKEQELVTKFDASVKEQNSKDHYVIIEDKEMSTALRGEVNFRQGDFLDICEDLNETTANYIRELVGK